MNNKKNLLRIGLVIGMAVLLFFVFHTPRHANAVCSPYPDCLGGGSTPTLAPTLNVVQAIGNTQSYLAWTNNDSPGTFSIYRSTDNVTFTLIATTTATTYTDHPIMTGFTTALPLDCIGGANYYYYIKLVVVGQTISPASNTGTAIYMCRPTIQAVSTASQSQLNVSWVDNTQSEAGYYVYRDNIYVGSTGAGVGNGTTLSFSDAAFTCGTRHPYYIVAYNGANSSANSTTVTGVTAPCVPTGGTISVVSPTQITASWTENGTWVDTYQIYRNGSLISSNTSNANMYGISLNDSGLQCGTSYGYVLRVWAGGVSTDSTTITGTTPSCVSAPAPVASPIATPVPGNPSINSSWTGAFDGVRVYLKGPTGYSLAGDFASAIKATSFAGLKCPYPYTAYYVAYNNDLSVTGTDVSCSNALSNAGISGPAAPTGAKCAAVASKPVDMRFCTQQFLGN